MVRLVEITEGPGRVVALTIAFAAGTTAGLSVEALGGFDGAGDCGIGEAGDGNCAALERRASPIRRAAFASPPPPLPPAPVPVLPFPSAGPCRPTPRR